MASFKSEHVICGLLFAIVTEIFALEGFERTNQGLCTRTFSVQRTRWTSERYLYKLTYKCGWWGRRTCWGDEWRTRQVPLQYTEAQSEEVCCSRYDKRYIAHPVYDYVCFPHCSQDCRHGKCTSPEYCSCDTGYRQDPRDRYSCLPVCSRSCVNGECTQPETCNCNNGYKKDSSDRYSCVPVCTKECKNGRCVAPEKCSCSTGYIEDPNNKFNCLPKCNKPCVNGKCTSPNVCTCDTGFAKDQAESHICNPVCRAGCENGKCTAPDFCTCDSGYEKHKTVENVCNPICSKECVNGICVKPETCRCLEGFGKDIQDSQLCHPICSKGCINSVCTAPDTCSCNLGFKKKENSSNVCEPHCSKGCENGYCVAPDKCACDFGFMLDENDPHRCHPVCAKECVNGDCTNPDDCTCWSGYKRNPLDSFVCEAHCTSECVNGKCVLPETCECDTGFVRNKEDLYTCDPFCEEQCINSNCTSPDTCECFEGYEMDSNRSNVCNPVCSQECRNGVCASPEQCQCLEGFEKFDSPNNCEPSCSECKDGVCVAPETCQCWSGYENPSDTNSTCAPTCDRECVNGFCSAPNECTCEEGYADDTLSGTCEPICSQPCINGNCSSPNWCECFPGYEEDESDSSSCNPVCSEECSNGICSEPETCTCFWGFVGSENNTNCSKSDNKLTDCSFLITLDSDLFTDENKTSQKNLKLENKCVFFDLIASGDNPTINLNCDVPFFENSVSGFLNVLCSTDSVTYNEIDSHTSSTVDISTLEMISAEGMTTSEFSANTENSPSYESTTFNVSVANTDYDTLESEFTSQSSSEQFSSSETEDILHQLSTVSVDSLESVARFDHDGNTESANRHFNKRSISLYGNFWDDYSMNDGNSREYDEASTTDIETETSQVFSEMTSSQEPSSELITETEESYSESSTLLESFQASSFEPIANKEVEDADKLNRLKNGNTKLKIEIDSLKFIERKRITSNYFGDVRIKNEPRCYCMKPLKWEDMLKNGFELQLTVCSCRNTLSRTNSEKLSKSSLGWIWIFICLAVLLGFIAFVLMFFMNKRRNCKLKFEQDSTHDLVSRVVVYSNNEIFYRRGPSEHCDDHLEDQKPIS